MLVDMNSWALIAVVMAFAFGADIWEFNGTYSHAASQMVSQIAVNFR
jgi:hypothetical protein